MRQITDSRNRSFGKQDAFAYYHEDRLMFRFDRLIRRDMIVRDVKQRHPETVPVFEHFGFHPVCDDCDIATGARKNGVNIADLLDAVNQAAFGGAFESQPETGEHASPELFKKTN